MTPTVEILNNIYLLLYGNLLSCSTGKQHRLCVTSPAIGWFEWRFEMAAREACGLQRHLLSAPPAPTQLPGATNASRPVAGLLEDRLDAYSSHCVDRSRASCRPGRRIEGGNVIIGSETGIHR